MRISDWSSDVCSSDLLSDKRVLLIIVTPDGDVQNRILFVSRDYLEQELLEASNFFNQHFAGMSFEQVRLAIADELSSLQADISRLMQAAVEAGAATADSDESLVLSGELGRAACRERVCQSVVISGGAVL